MVVWFEGMALMLDLGGTLLVLCSCKSREEKQRCAVLLLRWRLVVHLRDWETGGRWEERCFSAWLWKSWSWCDSVRAAGSPS